MLAKGEIITLGFDGSKSDDHTALIATLDELATGGRCRGCGCDDWHACPGGCAWVEDPDGRGELCSSCLIRIWNGERLPLDADGDA